MFRIMILLIILGSGAGKAAAAATAGPAGPAAPGLAELASQLCLSLGMIYVSILRVNYVPNIYRYLSGTVPGVSRLWYATICDTCTLSLSIHIVSICFTVSVFIRVLLYRTYLCTCTFYLYRLCYVRILYTVIPDPFGAAHSQFPEVVFVSIKCFAMGGGVRPRIKIFMPNPTICTNVMGGGV
jgi:hypothetical protein